MKEALACIFAVKKFHSYIFCRPLMLLTDHKPLLTLFCKCAEMGPDIGHVQIQDCIEAYGSTQHCWWVESTSLAGSTQWSLAELLLLVEHLLDSPVKAQEIRTWTRRHTAVMGKGVYSEWLASCSGTPVETLLVMSFGVDSGRWMHCVGVLCCRPHSSETACVATAPWGSLRHSLDEGLG